MGAVSDQEQSMLTVASRVLGRNLRATEVVYEPRKVTFTATDGKSCLKFTVIVEEWDENKTLAGVSRLFAA